MGNQVDDQAHLAFSAQLDKLSEQGRIAPPLRYEAVGAVSHVIAFGDDHTMWVDRLWPVYFRKVESSGNLRWEFRRNTVESAPSGKPRIHPAGGFYFRHHRLGGELLRQAPGIVAAAGDWLDVDDLSLHRLQLVGAVGGGYRLAGVAMVLPQRMKTQDFPWQTGHFSR